MSDHPSWAAPGSSVLVRRTAWTGRVDWECRATVLRHTATQIVLDNGDRFRRTALSDRYTMTPPYLDYTTFILPDPEAGPS